MRFRRNVTRVARGKLGVGGLAAQLAAVSLVGATGAGVGRAAGSVSVSATALNSPTPGGNIGYTATVSNAGPSTANHVILTESLGGDPIVAIVDASGSCSGIGTATLTCQIGQLAAHATREMKVLFRTSTSESSVTNQVRGKLDSQTPNSTNNRKTDTLDADVTTLLASTIDDTTRQIHPALCRHAGDGPAGRDLRLVVAARVEDEGDSRVRDRALERELPVRLTIRERGRAARSRPPRAL